MKSGAALFHSDTRSAIRDARAGLGLVLGELSTAFAPIAALTSPAETGYGHSFVTRYSRKVSRGQPSPKPPFL
jgi:hypothetical protein